MKFLKFNCGFVWSDTIDVYGLQYKQSTKLFILTTDYRFLGTTSLFVSMTKYEKLMKVNSMNKKWSSNTWMILVTFLCFFRFFIQDLTCGYQIENIINTKIFLLLNNYWYVDTKNRILYSKWYQMWNWWSCFVQIQGKYCVFYFHIDQQIVESFKKKNISLKRNDKKYKYLFSILVLSVKDSI